MKLAIRVLNGFALTIALAGTARADDLPAVTAKICSAAASVSSFVVLTSLAGTTGVSSRMTFVRPLRIKAVTTVGTMSTESYFVDGVVYVHSPMIGWQRMSVGEVKVTAASMNIANTLKSAKVSYLPDRQEDGTLVGVFQVESLPGVSSMLPSAPPAVATGPATQTMTCTFDKSTYRLRTCVSSLMTMTYSNYNDPANLVELPPDAKNAVPLVISTPAATQQEVPASPASSPAP
jgi:hypothetical protein